MSTIRSADTPTSTTASAMCPRCGRANAKVDGKHTFCSACELALERQARREQERDALARFLLALLYRFQIGGSLRAGLKPLLQAA